MTLFQDMTKKCFAKCIVKPGSSLDSSEQVINARFIICLKLHIFSSFNHLDSNVPNCSN